MNIKPSNFSELNIGDVFHINNDNFLNCIFRKTNLDSYICLYDGILSSSCNITGLLINNFDNLSFKVNLIENPPKIKLILRAILNSTLNFKIKKFFEIDHSNLIKKN